MRALVLGCGSIGSRHTANLTSLGAEVFVSDIDAAAAAALETRCGARAVGRQAAPGCDLVVVATPTSEHIRDLQWALERGSDVFVEKPLAASREGLARARALAGSHAGQNIMVGCSLRFSEGFAALSAHLAMVGRPVALLADYGWWLPSWRPRSDYRTQYSAQRALGGGIVLDAIHEIDYTLELLGPVDDVFGRCTSTGTLEVDVEDVADISIRHRDGAQSSIHLDYLRRRYSRSCTVIGSDGQITWDVPRGVVELTRRAGATPEQLAVSVDSDPNAQYMAEMRRVVATVGTHGTPPWNDVERASASVEVAMAALHGTFRRNTVAVIQARMGSTRLPGKVLADLCGRPLLEHVIARVSRAVTVDTVVVATTTDPADDAVAEVAAGLGVKVSRGPVDDVLTRFVMAARDHSADVIVRVTADCPLIDPTILDTVVCARAEVDAEYASNVKPPTYPEGYDIEAVTAACLARLDVEAVSAREREHVTARIRERPEEYHTTNVVNDRDLSPIRLTVDVAADLTRVARILTDLPAEPPPDLDAVVAYFESADESLRDQSNLPQRDERYRAQREAARRQEATQ
jgi:spore coat polysaccharide biosynthesis protein SpsF (cytidylyltransferase family)/predicted dehydrogenase